MNCKPLLQSLKLIFRLTLSALRFPLRFLAFFLDCYMGISTQAGMKKEEQKAKMTHTKEQTLIFLFRRPLITDAYLTFHKNKRLQLDPDSTPSSSI
mmetsp:Transcript_31566/g.65942  ORF Transcript_31566/g.65942 Transcript_31566/m.65942 type:complete len:96 (+) Transcript_31566:1114-1401(+)